MTALRRRLPLPGIGIKEIIMRSKLTWIPFALLLPAAVFCKIAPHLFEEGALFGLSSLMLEYAYIAAAVLLFLFAVLFCAIDKRMSQYYLPRRNIFVGVVGILIAIAFAADGGQTFFYMFGAGIDDMLKFVDSILLLISAVVFVVLGLTHLLRGSEGRYPSVLSVIPALLCGVRMIECFVTFTTISIRTADVASLICYVFATMFFFNYAVALTLTKAKRALKSCFVFGFPAVAALIGYSAEKLVFSFDTVNVLNNLHPVEMLLLGLYILGFLIELTAFVPEKDAVLVIESEEFTGDKEQDGDEGEDSENAEKKDNVEVIYTPEEVDGLIVQISAVDNKPEMDDASAYIANNDTEDYLYREVTQEDDPQEEKPDTDTENYLTSFNEDEYEDTRPKDYESNLDDIDKLILEITEQSD